MTLTALRATGLLAATLAIAGCGGGLLGFDESYTPTQVERYVQQRVALDNTLATLPRVSYADLPTSGQLTYEGTAAFGARLVTSRATDFLGAMEMTVDFDGAGDVTGRIFNIVSNGNEYTGEGAGPVEGELRIENGAFDRAPVDPLFQPHFQADLVGRLVDSVGPLDFDGQIDGRFRGNDLEMVQGVISGTAAAAPGLSDLINGTFVVAAD